MKIERAEYEALLAQKRYEEVDPANRLVAATLERRWNDALVNWEQIKQQYTEYQLKHNIDLSAEKKEEMLMLAQDIPALWKTASTPAKDRKRIIRLLIKDITVEKVSEQKKLILHIRWQGGANEDIPCTRPPKMCDKIRYQADIIEQVKEFSKTHIDDQIAELFNQKGLRSAKGKPYNAVMIKWIRHKHNIPAPELKTANESTIKEVAKRFDVSTHMVYYWIEKGYINARRVKQGYPYWITLTPAKEKELRARIRNSYKLIGNAKHS